MEGRHYDTIVIGSGMSGLSCASLLAQMENSRVLMIERHFTAGGYTHSFSREGKYEWDVGIHYIGEMNPGTHYRALFDYITGDRVQWQAMPEVYERFVYPDLSFEARAGYQALRNDLVQRFPHQREALQAYFRDLFAASRWYGRFMLSKLLPTYLSSLAYALTRHGRDLALTTTGDYLRRRFQDPQLQAVLASQWGDVGLPPGQSAFAVHAVVVCHYLDGGYYPLGGAKQIANAVIPIVEAQGGRVLTRHRVERIILRGDRAVGVKVRSRWQGTDRLEEFYADRIISCAGAQTTYAQLLPKDYPLAWRRQLEHFPAGSAHVCAYVGFKESPARLGFKGENHWIYTSYDHDDMFAHRNDLLAGKAGACFLSFASLKDASAQGHTGQIIAFTDYAPFSAWRDKSWGKRGVDYAALKQRMGATLIEFVDRHYPGFADLVDYCEVSTPLTTENFTGHRHGWIYGLPACPAKLTAPWLGPRTPLKNLYLTGADVTGQGLVGAMMGGVLTSLVAAKNPWPVVKLLAGAMRLAKDPRQRPVATASI